MFDNSILENFTKSINKENYMEVINNIENLINEGIFFCENQLGGINILNSSQLFLIGSISNDTNINQMDSIDILVKINNPIFLEQDNLYLSTKRFKKKSNLITSKTIKEYLIYFFNQRLTNLSKVYFDNVSITIKSQYELGKDFRIFVMVSSSENSGKCTALLQNGKSLFTFDVNRYFELMQKKENETKGAYTKIITIFKNLFAQLSIQLDNYIIEDLLYNVPNELYEGTYNEQIFKIINYIKIKNKLEFENIVSNNNGYTNGFYQTSILIINQVFQKLSNNLK